MNIESNNIEISFWRGEEYPSLENIKEILEMIFKNIMNIEFNNIEISFCRGEEYPSLEEFLFTQSGNIDIGYQVNSSMQFSYGPEYLAFEICYQIEKQY